MNFGIIFAAICLLGGILTIVFYQPLWWIVKKQEIPDNYKWCLRIPGIILMLIGAGIILMSLIESYMF